MTAKEKFDLCQKNFLKFVKNYTKWAKISQLRKPIKNRGSGTGNTLLMKL